MSANLRIAEPASVITLRMPTALLRAIDAQADARLSSRTLIIVRACEALMAALDDGPVPEPLPTPPSMDAWRSALADEVERDFYEPRAPTSEAS